MVSAAGGSHNEKNATCRHDKHNNYPGAAVSDGWSNVSVLHLPAPLYLYLKIG
ncbi:hypothetical protein [Geotalea toluenoxydans]|uniref:hypothetical protein n=1 Tax=Geotalea toluenoxydans TaxID=421624 RepID=UPI001FB3A606|nr:hypothetical protein [Geotalea toluenoxydans]